MNSYNNQVIRAFRATNGAIGGAQKLLLLSTKGSRTGKTRIAPLVYFERDGETYVVGSRGGYPEDPAWVGNIAKNPQVGIEQATDNGIEAYQATAQILDRKERDSVYAFISATNPEFVRYEERVERIIPVIVIRPARAGFPAPAFPR